MENKSGYFGGSFPFSTFCFPFFLWLIFLALPTAAQTVSGVVTDQKNAPIQNAEVSLYNKPKILAQTATDADGKFAIALQNTQNALLEIKAQGFATFSKTLSPNFSEKLKIILEPQPLRDEVTVSITRTESRLSETPASVIVLNRENLETTAAQTVDDSLRQIASFTLFRRSSSKTTNPTTQGANLRGLAGSGASRTSVLLDGLSLNDAFGGWTFWSRVPNIAVSQAEVLRGGASAFYGDQGLSGAVSLRTSSFNEKPIFRFQTSAGTQETFDGSLFTAYGKRGWNFDLALETFQTKGYIPTAETERGTIDTNANSRHSNGFLTIEKRFDTTNRSEPSAVADGLNFNISRLFVKTNIFGERRDNGTSLTNNQTYFRQIALGADFSGENIGAFQFRSFIEKQTYDQTFSAISNNRNTETLSRIQRVPSQSFGANVFWSKIFGADHVVSSSLEFKQVRGFSDEIVFVNNRQSSLVGAGGNQQIFGVFVQDAWRVTKKLNINPGGRFDYWENKNALVSTKTLANNLTNTTNFPDRNETAFSPRIAALYAVNGNFSVVASYAKSFRAPNLNELYRAFRVGNVLTLANENLRSERADTFETGLNFVGFARKLNLRGNFFIAEVSRPVVSVTLTTAPNLITRQRQNVGKTRAKGFEFDADYAPFGNLRFSASYLFTDSRFLQAQTRPQESVQNVELTGKFLPQVARNQLTFQSVYRPLRKLTFSLQARFSGAQFEDDLNTLRLRPYAILDAFISYKFKKIEIFSAAENLFDSRYDIGLTPNRTAAAPRFVRIGLRFDLGSK
ncbi:MAG: TonB-dependent receptor [Pyrinomonadaceae bacterium]|nr:TonB-dependent receptor [Pyrinomonadaceae bacterium]